MVVTSLLGQFSDSAPPGSEPMSGISQFSQMSIEQRELHLETLAKRLHLLASIAQHDGDKLWTMLEELANQLDLNQLAIAEDYSPSSSAVVEEATLLLGKFELDIPNATLH